jgi:hypothetical protein
MGAFFVVVHSIQKPSAEAVVCVCLGYVKYPYLRGACDKVMCAYDGIKEKRKEKKKKK